MFVTYDVVLNDANGAPVADFMLEVMDEYDTVIASAYTDMFGRASFKLEEGYYTVTAYKWDVPSGYKCSAETLLANEITVPYFYEFPSSDPTTPSIYDPSEYGYVSFDLAAGKTGYFLARGIIGKMLVIEYVNADTVLTLGYVDENGEWVVTATATAVGVEQYGQITYTLSIEIPDDPMALLPQRVETRFAITNGSEEEDIYDASSYITSLPGEPDGTDANPYILTSNQNSLSVTLAENQWVYYKYTAVAAGSLEIAAPFSTTKSITIVNETANADAVFLNGATEAVTVNFAEGDVIMIIFATWDNTTYTSPAETIETYLMFTFA